MPEPLDYETPQPPPPSQFWPTREHGLAMAQYAIVVSLMYLIEWLTGWSTGTMVLVGLILGLLSYFVMRHFILRR